MSPTVHRGASLLLGKPKNNTSAFARLEEQACFRNVTLAVIVLNALWIAVDVEWNHAALRRDGRLPLEPASTAIELVFCAFFSAELAVRFLAFRRKVLCLWDGWFVFDATLVALMVLETWILPLADAVGGGGDSGGMLANFSSFRLLRLLRLTRMAKIMRSFPELLTLVRSIVDATQAVFFILLFLVIVVYVFAIVFTTQLGGPRPRAQRAAADGADDPSAAEMFSDLGSSMMTLFTNGVLGDNLAQTFLAIRDQSLVLMWLFVLFVLISGVTLLNMLIGVLCQVIDDRSKEEEQARRSAELRGCLTEAFRSADTSDDGRICEAEWSRIREDGALRSSLARLGVEEECLDEHWGKMQESLFAQHDGEGEWSTPRELSFEGFVEQIMELRWDTPAKTLDMEMLKATVTLEDGALRRQLDRIEAGLAQLLGRAAPEAAPGPEGSAREPVLAGAGAPEARGRDARPSGRAIARGRLAEVPTELLFGALRVRR
uniref:Ion transport domain-containing protein n=1 Tax=Alexandrium monilatum TaxID=311494 RepID=A0A7S4T4E2_9DINO|mmetsp:Transcript_14492/g.45368  ORF Transcript_14492/g.45368 Transcript_14492/m.45368 type:complete len:489 (-) Transcript_14492:144-1610(-)